MLEAITFDTAQYDGTGPVCLGKVWVPGERLDHTELAVHLVGRQIMVLE